MTAKYVVQWRYKMSQSGSTISLFGNESKLFYSEL